MNWRFCKKREPTTAEVWADTFKEFVKLKNKLKEPGMKEAASSFADGMNGLGKELAEIRDMFLQLFDKK